MKKKVLKIILGSSTGLIILAIIILVPVLMILDFFGAMDLGQVFRHIF